MSHERFFSAIVQFLPNRHARWFALTFLVGLGATLAASIGAAEQEPTGNSESFNPRERIQWTSSRMLGTPEPPPPYRLERVYPQLKFREPVAIVAEPGSQRMLVVEHYGTVYRFEDRPDVTEREIFLELGDEAYSLAFHPQYLANGRLFVFRNLLKDKRMDRNRIAEFRTSLDAQRTCAKETEKPLLEWASRGHNGGDMAFGPDGLLYISSGDGETGIDDPDPQMTGQDMSDLCSGILRIDVDRTDTQRQTPYAIPADNPFVDVPNTRPELWAVGLRNPWRMSFDPATGRLWLGDNGEESWESVYLGKRGANYGWSRLEGGRPFNLARPAAPYPFEPPIVSHPHSESRSVMGGRVYRGKHEELRGTYLYGDHETGKIWGLRYDGERVTSHRELVDTKRKVIAFGEDHAGELLIVTFDGEIFRLEPRPDTSNSAEFPRVLSATGLFRSTTDLQPAAGLIPYSINAPAWADGAKIDRFLAVPGESQIKYQRDRGWEFPQGAVIAQTFSLPMGDGKQHRRIETRLLQRHEGEWFGYSYRWRTDQSDAELVGASGDSMRLDSASGNSPADAVPGALTEWRFPSRAQCMVCHSLWGPRFVIGVSTEQLNREHDYGGTKLSQVDVLRDLGILDKPPRVKVETLARLAQPTDERAPLADRARAYLHANCAHCHRYGGAGNAKMRLAIELTPETMRAFDLPPEHGGFGLRNAKLIASSAPESSVILYRLAKAGRGHMPPMGSQTADPAGLQLVHNWMASLESPEGAVLESKERELITTLTQRSNSAPDRQRALLELLSGTSGALLVTLAIDRNELPAPLEEMAVARGTSHLDRNIRELFERFLPPSQRRQRLGETISPEHILSLKGNADDGRHLFLDATLQCRNCHRVAGRGNVLGPDLDRLAKRYSRAELLDSILNPSKTIDQKYQNYSVTTTAGRVVAGLLLDKTPQQLALRDQQGNTHTIASGDIESAQPLQRSFMPSGLLRELSAQEAADLVEFLFQLNSTTSVK